jgi:endonuclease/exonuclease/phosphatase family metal-dependent hydrolase
MIDENILRVITTHMGLKFAERRTQAQKLVEMLEQHPDKHTLLLGDMNEWLYGSPTLKMIDDHLSSPNLPASFKSSFPLFSLDRIWGKPSSIFSGEIRAHRTRLSRQASDHLPVYADIKLV